MVYFSSTVKRSQGWLFFSWVLRKEEDCPLLTVSQMRTLFEGLCPSDRALPVDPFMNEETEAWVFVQGQTGWKQNRIKQPVF